ncbi:hypothetical protein Unana1_05368 [Umbelopsis nana]
MASPYYYNPAAGNPQNPNMTPMHPMGQMQIGMQPNAYAQPPYRGQVPIVDPSMRKRMPSKSKPSGPHPPNEDADEPSGDELDDISTRDIAMARYKRNHDYLSEIFTPYTASSIIPPPFNLSKSEEELKQSTQQADEEIARSKENHTERLNSIRQRVDGFWTAINVLKEAFNLEGVSLSQQTMEESLQLKIERSSEFVREVEIPGQDAEDPLPDHISNMMANTSTIPGGESQMDSEPQIESEFEAQLMASSNQHVENENKDAEFSWQADQSHSNPVDDSDFMFNEMMTTTPPQGETPSVNDYLQTPEYDNGNKSPEQSGNDDMANPTESNM